MQLIERINEKLTKESKSILTMSKETDIPAYRIYKWIHKRGNPKAEDTRKLEEWLNDNLDKVQNSDFLNVSDTNEAAYLAGRLDTKEEVIAEKEARRIDAERRADLAEKEKDRLLSIIEKNLTALLTNSNITLDRLSLVETIVRSDDTVIMNNQDRQSGNEIGTSAKEAGNRQLAADKMRKGKGSHVGVHKSNK